MSISIGRDGGQQGMDVTIPQNLKEADTVSQQHARILRRGNTYWVEDLGSTNFTYMDDRAVVSFREIVLPCDKLRLGNLELSVEEKTLREGELKEAVLVHRKTALKKAVLSTRNVFMVPEDWPEIDKEIRWSSALDQVLQTVRDVKDPDAAAVRVASIVAIYERAKNAVIRVHTDISELPDILRNCGIDAPDAHAKIARERLRDERSPQECICIPFSSFVMYAQTSISCSIQTLNLCVVHFGKASNFVSTERATQLIMLSLSLLDTVASAWHSIKKSQEAVKKSRSLQLPDEVKRLCDEHQYWGESPAFVKMLKDVSRAAETYFVPDKMGLPIILLTGETGVGKTKLVEVIRELSGSATKPYVTQSGSVLAGMDTTHLRSELFGHEIGAFTGATEQRKGLFERARNGILFLDEIGVLDQYAQQVLLTAITTGEFTRLGGSSTLVTNCYVILATNSNLEEMVERKEFRRDLFARIRTWSFEIPPLWKRPDDIKIIAQKYIEFLYDKKPKKHLSPALLEILMKYNWPDNIRSLVDSLDFACRFSETDEIAFCDLPPDLQDKIARRVMGNTADEPQTSMPDGSSGGFPTMKEVVAEVERKHIIAALERTHGNDEKARTLLKLSRSTYYDRTKKFGLREKQEQ